MAKRSLNASSQGLARARQAFQRKGWTQEYLAAEVGLSTRQSIWKFFSGKPVERNIFVEICFILGLEWEDIADLPKEISLPDIAPVDSDSDHLKEEDFITFKRQYNRVIENQCAVLQSYFEVSSPQNLAKLYTQTYFLPYLSEQQWLEVAELESSSRNYQQRRSLNPSNTKLIAAQDLLKNQSKVFIMGKPGSGKTTFLQHLALQCQANQIFTDCIPIFLRANLLKLYDSAAPQLNFITILQQQLNSPKQFNYLLEQGKLLILLDGLDEVCQSLRDELLLNVQTFSETYDKNYIVINSRLATKLYYIRGFAYVEISEFTPEQVRSYVNNWFTAQFDHNPEAGKQKAARFLQALELKENQGIQELTVTPIFLSFLCSIYHHKESFPSNRYKLCQTGLDILLVRWDQSKGINRDQFYEKLSVTNKIKLLSHIAEENFQKGKYFLRS